MDLLEGLKTALKMEKDGYELYMAAAKKTQNKLGRATFEAVAAKEIDHIKAIEDFAIKQSDDQTILKDLESVRALSKVDYISQIMAGLKKQIEQTSTPEADLNHAYKAALDLEKKAYDFYKSLYNQVTEPKVKALFHFLMQQENIHYELFQETLEYLDHPGDWFKEQERWIVEG